MPRRFTSNVLILVRGYLQTEKNGAKWELAKREDLEKFRLEKETARWEELLFRWELENGKLEKALEAERARCDNAVEVERARCDKNVEAERVGRARCEKAIVEVRARCEGEV
ncbi:hypothetical protein BDZ91DRAFT_799078 [Kalaharituber pfeilii]|nr:hypothetical protein BDZ91DRAFT_799078 [Kalaharituber pfeilii]